MTTPEGLPLPGCTPTLVAAADDALLPLQPETLAPGMLVAHALPPSLAAIEAFVRSRLPQFGSPSGVLLLLWSVLLSRWGGEESGGTPLLPPCTTFFPCIAARRGLGRVAADMDEAAPLVARFGHCTQVCASQ